MPLTSIFNEKKICKDNDCKVNKKFIKKVFKPDDGFLDTLLEKKLFGKNYKICDCIIICENENIIVHEILCGKLTYSEYKDKTEQLKNCLKVLEYCKLLGRIKKVVLQYKKIDNHKNPQFKKILLKPKINNFPLLKIQDKLANIEC